MLPLTKEQRVKVEENMGLVGKVIGDCVHTLDKGCIYTYDDLFQIGCIGLCKAAQTDQPGHKGAFSTYAYCLIRNEIYTQIYCLLCNTNTYHTSAGIATTFFRTFILCFAAQNLNRVRVITDRLFDSVQHRPARYCRWSFCQRQ